MGVGRALTDACIALARKYGQQQVVLHTTQVMQVAWNLYEKSGFVRSPDLDFSDDRIRVYGFRLNFGS